MVTVTLRIQPELCGPVSVGTVVVIRALQEHLGLPLKDAFDAVNAAVFDGETVHLSAPSREAADALIAALSALPPVPRIAVDVLA